MILGIMQPYFFPYLGYFDHINVCDRWVVFDVAQYIRRGYVNRNRILHPRPQGGKEWQWIIAPVKKHSRNTLIKDIQVTDGTQWKKKIIGQLNHYKKRAKNYSDTVTFIEECFDTEDTSLARLNVRIMQHCCHKLGIAFEYSIFSEMNLNIGSVNEPGEWALRISEAMGADEYVNPPGGRHLFDPEKFRKIGCKLTIREPAVFAYKPNGFPFVEHLSIIDVMMWNSVEEIRVFLKKHKELGTGKTLNTISK
jgi:hypothetical protein